MAGKGKRPEGGVDWGKQYERSPFLSSWEKKLLAEEQEELYNQGEGVPYRELPEDVKGEIEFHDHWKLLPSCVVEGSFRREDLQELSEYRESKGV